MQDFDPHYVTSRGTYADVENNRFINLTSEQMKKLYELYPDELRTIYKVYLSRQKNVPRFSLKREKKGGYIKKFDDKFKYVAIFGTFLVTFGSAIILPIYNSGKSVDVVKPIEMQASSHITSAPKVDEVEKVFADVEDGVVISEDDVVSEEEFISSEAQYQVEMSTLVNHYCDVYEVDKDIVYRKLCELTDNFNSEEFMQNGYIPGVTCKKKEVYTDNKEFSILTAVRAVSQLPNRFGLTYDEVHTGTSYEANEPYEELIAKYAEIFGIPEYRDLAYGIFRAETGGNSKLLVEQNNYGGLKSSTREGFDSQANRHMGAIEFISTLKYVYIDNGLDTPMEIQPIYAPSYENDGEQWVYNVEWNMKKAETIYEELNKGVNFNK